MAGLQTGVLLFRPLLAAGCVRPGTMSYVRNRPDWRRRGARRVRGLGAARPSHGWPTRAGGYPGEYMAQFSGTPSLGVIFASDRPPEELRGVVRAAEESGLDELWLWEDCFAEGSIASAAAALGWTERLRVGIGIIPVPLRNVALTAMELATLARLFPDRIAVGVGHGVAAWLSQVGANVRSPMTLLCEYTIALRRLLSGETVSVAGRYVTLRDVVLAWPPEPPLPVLMGAMGPRTLHQAGVLADGVILSELTTLDQMPDVLAHVGLGTKTGYSVVSFVDVHDSLPAAQIAELTQRYYEAGATTVALHSVGDDRPPLASFVRMVAEEVAPRLR
jgi:alkanesulfonate monooxygenase SsuD/methylene tetrahydromethanopterin reductase-like flavin-dependent oxidoreductase (luciferase family)